MDDHQACETHLIPNSQNDHHLNYQSDTSLFLFRFVLERDCSPRRLRVYSVSGFAVVLQSATLTATEARMRGSAIVEAQ
jgi:hypothetical protein